VACEAEDQDAYVDLRVFEGSWYVKNGEITSVLSFFHNIAFKDVFENGKKTEHLEYGMVESVSKTTVKFEATTYEYRFEANKLFLRPTVEEHGINNYEWTVYDNGKPLYYNEK